VSSFWGKTVEQPWPIRAKSLKNRYFGAEPTNFLEIVQILALNMTIFQKFGPRADLGWP
jgi:hypothetical protein